MSQAPIELNKTPPYTGVNLVNDANAAFAAVATNFAGETDPALNPENKVKAYMTWADTGTGYLKRRNAANSVWETEGELFRRSLPMRTDVPTTDQGDFHKIGFGTMIWNGSAYAPESSIPIGKIEIQFPGEKTPSELYGGTWTQIFNTEGVFFRTEGGNASAFGSGVQGDAMRNISGTAKIRTYGTPTGVFGASSSDTAPEGTVATSAGALNIDASRQVPTANEFRPSNMTMRIWKKTA